MESHDKSVKKNYFWNLLFEIVVVIYPLIVTPYLSRVLLPSGIGIKTFTYSIMTYFYYVGMLGIDIYGQKEIAKYKNDIETRTRKFYELLLLKFVTMGLAIIAYLFLMVGFNIGHEYRIIYAIWTLFLVESFFNIKWFYQGIEKFKYISIFNTFSKIISIVFIFLLIKTPDDLWLYILILCLTPIFTTLFMWIIVRKYLIRISFKGLKPFSHFKNTLIYFAPAIAAALYSTLDRTMLKFITKSEDEVGYYEQAHKLITLTVTIVSSLFPVLRSRCSYLVHMKNEGEEYIYRYKKIISEYLHFTMFLSIPLALGILSTANDFVPFFFGESYRPTIRILQVLSPLIIILAISQFITSAFVIPFEKQPKLIIFYLLTVIINVIFNLIFIYCFGAIGAALATIISEMFFLCVNFIISREYINFFELVRISIKPFISSIIMLIGVFFFSRYVHLNNTFLKVMLEIISGACLYFIFMLILRDSYLLKNISIVLKKLKN